jgi:hypothetical protein
MIDQIENPRKRKMWEKVISKLSIYRKSKFRRDARSHAYVFIFLNSLFLYNLLIFSYDVILSTMLSYDKN